MAALNYNSQLIEQCDSDRQHLERSALAAPTQKEIRYQYGTYKIAYGKPYADRWLAQITAKYTPALAGEPLPPSEAASLPTAKALLTPTQIAAEPADKADAAEPINVWGFEAAPKEYRELSPHAGDEDWLAFIPASFWGSFYDAYKASGQELWIPDWMEAGSRFGCCETSQHHVKSGLVVIGCHA